MRAQREAQASALASAQRTLEIANNRYRAGLVTYLEVAISQSSELNLERGLVQLGGDQFVATVGLIRALGGGWEPDLKAEIRNPKSEARKQQAGAN